MSKNNNVNPGQYKVAGRERQGEDVDAKAERAKLVKDSGKGRRGPADNKRRKRNA